MSLRKKIVLGLTAVGLAGGTFAAALPAANAATMRCGSACVTLAAQKFGASNVVAIGAGSAAQLAAFGYNPSEDFYIWQLGTVSDFVKAGVIPASLAKVYGADPVYEYEYVPARHLTGTCLSVPSGAAAGTAVTLRSCGETASTLWIGVAGRQSGNYMPLVSAAASAKSALVLTAASASGAVTISQMSLSTVVSSAGVSSAGVSSAGVSSVTVAPAQMWQAVVGVYKSSTVTAIPDALRHGARLLPRDSTA